MMRFTHVGRTHDGWEYVSVPGGRVFAKSDVDELDDFVRRMNVRRYDDFEKFRSDKGRRMMRLAIETQLFGPLTEEQLARWVNTGGRARELGGKPCGPLLVLLCGTPMLLIAVAGFVADLAIVPLVVTSVLGYTPWWSAPAALVVGCAVLLVNERNETILEQM